MSLVKTKATKKLKVNKIESKYTAHSKGIAMSSEPINPPKNYKIELESPADPKVIDMSSEPINRPKKNKIELESPAKPECIDMDKKAKTSKKVIKPHKKKKDDSTTNQPKNYKIESENPPKPECIDMDKQVKKQPQSNKIEFESPAGPKVIDMSSNKDIKVKYDNFLKKYKIPKDNPKQIEITHTRIGSEKHKIYGASYHIPQEALDEFYDLYYEHVIQNKNEETLTEKQLADDGPILVDLDFRYAKTIKTRQHDDWLIASLVDLYAKQISEMLDVCNDFQVYVFEKEDVNTQDKNFTKDGIHLVFAVKMNRNLQLKLREIMIEKTKDILKDIPLKNKPEDVFDIAITKGGTNWQLYGSNKPGHKPYKLTWEYNVADIDYSTLEKFGWINFDLQETKDPDDSTFELFLARYDCNDKFEVQEKFLQFCEAPANCLEEKDQENLSDQTTDNDIGDNELQEVQEIAFNIDSLAEDEKDSFINKYDDYRRITWSFEGHKSLYETAKRIMENSWIKWRKEPWDEDTFRKLYYSYKAETGIKRATLYYYSKLSNEEEFNKIINKSDSVYDLTDAGIAETFYKYHGKNYVISGEDKNEALYFWNGIFWKKYYKNSTIIEAELVKFKEVYNLKIKDLNKNLKSDTNNNEEADDETTNPIKQKITILNKIIKRLKSSTGIRQIGAYFKYFIKNDNISWDNNPHLYCFQNRVYNLYENEFITPNQYDFCSQNTGQEYIQPTQEKIDLLNSIIEQIFPEEEVGHYYLTFLGLGLTGLKQIEFLMANGSGGNGKGLINELVMVLMGVVEGSNQMCAYAYNGNTNTLTSKKAISDGACAAVANMHKKRLVRFTEPDEDKDIQKDTVTKLTGDSSINARPLFSNDTHTKLPTLFILECNSRPGFSGRMDSAVERRLRDIYFEAKFIPGPEKFAKHIAENPDDKNVYLANSKYMEDKWRVEYQFALFHILTEKLRQYWENKNINGEDWEIPVPKQIADRSAEYIEANDDILSWIRDNFEYEEGNKNEDYVNSTRQLYQLWHDNDTVKKSQCKEEKFRRMMEECTTLRKKGYFPGLKKIVINDKAKQFRAGVLVGYKYIYDDED
jgi:hypothetical protein